MSYTMKLKTAGQLNLLLVNLQIILAGGIVPGLVTGYTLKRPQWHTFLSGRPAR